MVVREFMLILSNLKTRQEKFISFQTKKTYRNDKMPCHQSTILTLTSLYFATKGTPVLVNFFFSLLAEVSSLFLLSSKERQRGLLTSATER